MKNSINQSIDLINNYWWNCEKVEDVLKYEKMHLSQYCIHLQNFILVKFTVKKLSGALCLF